MMRYQHYGKIITGVFLVLVAFYVVASRYVPAVYLTEFSYSFQVAIGWMVAFVFLREVWLRDRSVKFTMIDLVMLAVACKEIASTLETQARLWSRLRGTVLDDASIAFYRLLIVFFAMILIGLRGTPRNPRLWDWTSLLALALGAGALILTIVLYDRLRG